MIWVTPIVHDDYRQLKRSESKKHCYRKQEIESR